MVKILQGSVSTQTTLGGQTIYPRVANFLQCICEKIWKLAGSGHIYRKNQQADFLGPPCLHFRVVRAFVVLKVGLRPRPWPSSALRSMIVI